MAAIAETCRCHSVFWLRPLFELFEAAKREREEGVLEGARDTARVTYTNTDPIAFG